MVRKAAALAQEELDSVSGRTYVSQLERGLKQPTLHKVDQLATAMGVHPLTLLTLSYCAGNSAAEIKRLQSRVEAETIEVLKAAVDSSADASSSR